MTVALPELVRSLLDAPTFVVVSTVNLDGSPRSTPAQPYSYFTVDGEVTLVEEGDREPIDELSRKNTGQPYTFDGPDAVRVVCRLTPRKVVAQ